MSLGGAAGPPRGRRRSAPLAGVGLAVAALLAHPTEARAGAWTRPLGSHYAKVSADAYHSLHYRDPLSDSERDIDYLGVQIGVGGEVGVLPVWPVQVSAWLPLVVGRDSFGPGVVAGADAGSATSVRLGDLRAGLQGALVRRRLNLSAAIEVKVPLYDLGTIGAGSGDLAAVFPRPGDGQVDVSGLLWAGGSLPRGWGWVQGAAGFLHRTEVFPGTDPGVVLGDCLLLRAQAGLTLPRSPVQLMLQGEATIAFVPDEWTKESVTVGPSMTVTVWRGLAVEARFSVEPWARNASQGIGFGLALSWQGRGPLPAPADRPPPGQ